jgi:hypothetical protein
VGIYAWEVTDGFTSCHDGGVGGGNRLVDGDGLVMGESGYGRGVQCA